jgi:hypothetical protein
MVWKNPEIQVIKRNDDGWNGHYLWVNMDCEDGFHSTIFPGSNLLPTTNENKTLELSLNKLATNCVLSLKLKDLTHQQETDVIGASGPIEYCYATETGWDGIADIMLSVDHCDPFGGACTGKIECCPPNNTDRSKCWVGKPPPPY